MKFLNFYNILGVSRNASVDEIRKNYLELVKKYHTDNLVSKLKSGEITKEEYNKASNRIKDINSAYNILSSDKDRIIYDKLYDRIQRRKNSSNNKGFINNIKRSYKEIKREEFRQPSFSERHSRIDDIFYDEYFDEDMNNGEYILFQTKRGAIHVSLEFLYNINKLKYNKRENLSKYVIRNRKLAAFVVAAGIAIGGVALITGIKPGEDDPIVNPITTTSSSIDVNNYYTVKAGDTISGLAKRFNTTEAKIQKANYLENSYIYIGDELIIPSSISVDDIEDYTDVATYDFDTTIEEFAEMHKTDVTSLANLNKEAIKPFNNDYIVYSDTLNVPSFDKKNKKNMKSNY